MEAEMDTTLGCSKTKAKKSKQRTAATDTARKQWSANGETELAVPRDRDGEHEPLIVKKHQKNLTGIEEQIIAMNSKGMTVRDIQEPSEPAVWSGCLPDAHIQRDKQANAHDQGVAEQAP